MTNTPLNIPCKNCKHSAKTLEDLEFRKSKYTTVCPNSFEPVAIHCKCYNPDTASTNRIALNDVVQMLNTSILNAYGKWYCWFKDNVSDDHPAVVLTQRDENLHIRMTVDSTYVEQLISCTMILSTTDSIDIVLDYLIDMSQTLYRNNKC